MKRALVLHPFLFSAFPVLALYAYNVRSIPVSPGELAWPLAASVAGAALLFLALRAALGDADKAGLLVSVVAVWFYSFGHIAGRLAVWTEGIYNRSLFFATALLVALAAFFVVRSRRTFGGLTRALNAAAATLVLLNAFSAGRTLVRRPHAAPVKDVSVSRQAASRPNIYYIVLDAYTRSDVLRDVFGHDNGPFLAALEERGFAIAGRSYANYNLTHQSLASSLNFVYLDELARDAGEASSDREPLYEMIRKNRAMAFLKGQGYRLIALSSSIEPTDIKTADLYIGFRGLESEFRTALLNTTPLPLFLRPGSGVSPYEAHRKRILNAFRALQEAPLERGPFFLFVHLMSPHPPFVFGPQGEPRDPDYLFSMVDADRLHGASEAAIRRYIPAYRDQVSFINTKVLEAVDAILSRSPEPPVIILQGDHGSRAYADLDRPEGSYFEENLAILNAYHLPGDGARLLTPHISPVNTFRLIFKHYFGADLELFEDRSAWTTWRRPYKFIPFEPGSYAATLDSVKRAMVPKAPAVQKR